MPIYCFICYDCGYTENNMQPMPSNEYSLKHPICPNCDKYLDRNLQAEGCNFVFGNGNLCQASSGYATNIEDAELFWEKEGKPVGDHVDKLKAMPKSEAKQQGKKPLRQVNMFQGWGEKAS